MTLPSGDVLVSYQVFKEDCGKQGLFGVFVCFGGTGV
jgi:hypothetical protein